MARVRGGEGALEGPLATRNTDARAPTRCSSGIVCEGPPHAPAADYQTGGEGSVGIGSSRSRRGVLLVREKGRQRAVLNLVWDRRGEGGRAVVCVRLARHYSREKANELQ